MILDEILEATERRVHALSRDRPARSPFPPGPGRSLARAISRAPGNAIIAELKFASPSRGRIRTPDSPGGIARDLAGAGCCALSVVTEPEFFGGSPEILVRARQAVGVPVLRKDFIIDPLQLVETRALGADAILLIASILGERLPLFVARARHLGIEPLVEVRSREEGHAAIVAGAGLVGINNRDLRTLETDLATTLAIGPDLKGQGRQIISESGIRTPDHVRALRHACDAFLVGSSLMAAEQPAKALEALVCA